MGQPETKAQPGSKKLPLRAPVRQHDDYGCGPACVAFVAGMEYGEIALEMTKSTQGNPWTPRGFWCAELVATLHRVGFPRAAYTKYTKEALLAQDDVIVFFKGGEYTKYGHFVVRWGAVWMCPDNGGKFIDDSKVTNVEWIIYPHGLDEPATTGSRRRS